MGLLPIFIDLFTFSFVFYNILYVLSKPFVNAILADNSTALLAGILAQIEKQLKLISLSLSHI